MSKTLVTNLVE